MLGLAVMAVLAGPAAARADPCAPAEVDAAAAQAHAGRQALLALPIGDGRQTQVSPDAQAEIERFKDQLFALVTASVRCAGADADPARLAQDLAARAGAAAAPDGRYGSVLRFEARRPASPADVLAVKVNFGIECGEDGMVLVYVYRGGAWTPVVQWRAAPYSTIAGAFWSLDYAISPPDADGRWYLAVKSISPWCSSAWSVINFAALRPGAAGRPPKVLLHHVHSIWFGGDDYGRLTAAAQDFELRFHAESIDAHVGDREFIRRFAVEGDDVRRVAPVASSPRDFVDEWIVTPWEEAGAWTARTRGMRALHARLRKDGAEGFEFDTVMACAGRPRRTQVELTPRPDQPGARAYYAMVAGDGDFRLAAVTRAPNPACGGENLLASMATK